MTSTKSTVARFAPAFVAAAAALTSAGFGHWLRAAVVGAVALLAAGLAVAGIDPARAFGRSVGMVIGVVLWVVVILPQWIWGAVTRRDLLRRSERASDRFWTLAAADQQVGRLGSTPVPAGAPSGLTSRRTPTGRLAWVIGVVVLAMIANYAIGFAWDEATGGTGSAASAATAQSEPHNPRADLPAMAAYPWRNRYFADLRRTPSTYWPFTEIRPLSFSSPYINIDDWVRRSYEPSATGVMPTVWVFGGSTTFGEGQRDLYTIPSDVSRLANGAGTPIHVVNYGQRGWTQFQEMILFEQLLAAHRAPDFAVFYDGANELTSQALMTEAVPSTPNVLDYARKLSGTSIVTRATAAPGITQSISDFLTAYESHSAINKLAHWIGLGGGEAGATTTPSSDQNPLRGFNVNGVRPDASGQGFDYSLTIQDAKNALNVLQRGQFLIQALATKHHVRPVFFWQPTAEGDQYDWASAHVKPPRINLSHVLDNDGDVYIDGGHTNEVGARIVATAIWAHLRDQIASWYQQHR